MALTKTPIELSSTPGIVDNSNATAITIDSSENVMVNRTSVFTTAKMEIQSDASDASTLALNSIDTDGSMLEFYKAGSTVGSIGTGSSLLTIGTGTGNLVFTNALVAPCSDSSAGSSNGVVDLGSTSRRFKDLHISGKAYMTGLEPGQVTITSASYFIGNTSAGYRFNNAADNANLLILRDNGDLMLGYTAPLSSSKLLVSFDGTSHNAYVARTTRTGTNSNFAVFLNSSNQVAGTITHNGSTTVNYSASSDQRLKENIADADDSGSIMDAIQVRKFDWIDGGAHEKYGFIAQELNNIAPNAVCSMGMPDEEDPMLGVDPSKLMALAIKEIQMLRARVAELENNS